MTKTALKVTSFRPGVGVRYNLVDVPGTYDTQMTFDEVVKALGSLLCFHQFASGGSFTTCEPEPSMAAAPLRR